MKSTKLILATLFLLCLAQMPYGYYMLVRFIAMVAFAIMAYHYYEEKKEYLAITFGVLAILFQPLIKIALGRTIWNIVDVVVAIFLILLWVKERKS